MARIWTEDEKRIVAEMYPDHFASEIAKLLGKPVSGVHRIAGLLGVKSSREKIIRAGKITANNPNSIASRFWKGRVPESKGKKRSPEVYEKVKRTMFKKGHLPVNYKPVGSERTNADGYVEIKVADPGKWSLKHRVLWEKEYGPIPKGYNVQFKDGNRKNVCLENLYLISRSEQLIKENSMVARYPQELRQVIMLKGALKRKINEHNKKQ